MTQTAEREAAQEVQAASKTMTMAQAITDALDIALQRDKRVIMYGEDVGVMGGVFRITAGLQAKHGKERVFDSPLTESGIMGTAVGAAAAGMRPVVELQFAGFAYPALDQIISHVSRYRYRSRGRWSTPITVRMPFGGGLNLLEQHADSPETYLVHTPGIKVVVPSTPQDAKGLVLAAIEDPDPVFILENIKLYRSIKEEVPTTHYTVELGKAKRVTEGNDVTVLAWGAMVQEAVSAAKAAQEAGIGVEVLDLRSLMPLDLDAILESVEKTGRLVIVHEANLTGGLGGEISALVAERAIYHLEAPIVRVAGFDIMASPFNAVNHFTRPDAAKIADGIKKVLNA
ncbi:MAG TPA: alpha-ketoacid dehydrogenase subunit beta [Deinococcales bacterium]|nr:alpha-ketoacid dehydrogenase subunit beta [Deinococcales bacterium]